MELCVNLKVCEACGCLWYRAQVDTKVYCTACHEKLKDFPTPQSRKRRGRPRKITLPTVFAVATSPQMIWAIEGCGFNRISGLKPRSGDCAGGYGIRQVPATAPAAFSGCAQ